jgi:ATP-dependent Clp protease ATP-binding subunit ClpX
VAGLIPEFVGRFPVVVNTNGLTLEQMVRVLTEPKNALIKQYRYLFSLHDVDLHITHDALREVATIALRKNTVCHPLVHTCTHKQVHLPPMLDVSGGCRVPAVCVRSWRRC